MDKKVLVMLLLVVCCYGADPSDETATDDDNGGSNADGNEGGDNDGNDEVTSEPEPEPEDDGPKPPRVIIIGAGMAGISAARKLDMAGIHDFLVLEARGEIGGRLQTIDVGGYTLEAGNWWVQGGKGNPIFDKSEQYGVNLTEAEYDYVVRGPGGTNVTEDFDSGYDVWDPAVEYLDNKTMAMLSMDLADLDQSVVMRQGGWSPMSPLHHLIDLFEVDFEYSVPPKIVSTKYTGRTDEFPDEDYVAFGFNKLVEGLAEDTLLSNETAHRLMLNTTVTEIHQNDSSVAVVTDSGETFVADHVIVTASLGVLQHRGITFVPNLPKWKYDSIDGFRFVDYLQIYVRFESTFWDDADFVLYSSPKRGYYPIWANLNWYYPGSNILQVVVFNSEAHRIRMMSEDDVWAEMKAVLEDMYGDVIPDLSDITFTSFGTDPLFMGAFSHWPPRFSHESHKALQAPVGCIHFAGEYANMKHYGLVLGSYLSGFDTADILGDCIKENKKSCDPHKPIHEARGCTYKEALNFDNHARVDDGSCKFPKVPDSATLPGISTAVVVFVVMVGRMMM